MLTVKSDCYRLVQMVALKQYPFCRMLGCGKKADAGHHAFPRNCNGTAFNPEAVISLCLEHHTEGDFSAHRSPELFEPVIKKIIGYKYDYLRELSLTVVQFREADYKRIRDALNRLLKG